MKKRVVLSLVLVAMLAFGIGMGTYAWFTDEAVVADNVFETGTLDIGVNYFAIPEQPWFIGFENMKPGDSETRILTVKNSGSLNLKYRITAEKGSGSSALYNQLNLKVTDIQGARKPLYEGPLNGLTTDRILQQLEAGKTQNLWFTVTLPETAGNDCQGKSTTVKFVFEATQLDNNDGDWGVGDSLQAD